MRTNKHHQYEIVSKTPIAYFWHWEGEIKKVRIVGCDFNKYVDMVCIDTGEKFHYKWGYVYNTYEDALLNKDFDSDAWVRGEVELDTPSCVSPHKLLLSNKDYAKFKKTKRKEESSATEWYVAVDEETYYNSKHFRTQKAALQYFGELDETAIEYAKLGEQNTYQDLIEFEDSQVWILEKDRKVNLQGYKVRTIKSRHVGKQATYKEWRK